MTKQSSPMKTPEGRDYKSRRLRDSSCVPLPRRRVRRYSANSVGSRKEILGARILDIPSKTQTEIDTNLIPNIDLSENSFHCKRY